MPFRHLVLNGQETTFKTGQTILEVAQSNQVHIPTLCHLKGATPTGACQICVVEVEGARTLMAACSTPASENMVVHTHSPKVIQARKMTLELMLSSGNHNCAAASAADVDDWTDFQQQVRDADASSDICPEDAHALGIQEGEMIQVAARRGTVTVRARITPEVPKGLVRMTFHFRENSANWLTVDAFESTTMTAGYKACSVSIEKMPSDS